MHRLQLTAWNKGRVERKTRHIRDNFFAARTYIDLKDLNRQAEEWCNGIASERPCPEDTDRTVAEAFADEQSKLLPLPAHDFDTDERIEVQVRKQPYARFDLNDYSVPHDHVRRTLEIRANLKAVRIFDLGEEVAYHHRSFDKEQQIEDPTHIEGLREYKKRAREKSRVDHLLRVAPSAQSAL